MTRPAWPLACSLIVLLPAAAAAQTGEVRFNRDIRPILSNRCFKCHGPDLKKASLDLQSRQTALAPRTHESAEMMATPDQCEDATLGQLQPHGNVSIEKEDARTGDLVVRSRFHMMEFRNDTTRHFAGSYVHHLKRTKGGHRIKPQRVDMVNAAGPYEYVLQAWV